MLHLKPITVYHRTERAWQPHRTEAHTHNKTEVVKEGNGLQYANFCVVRFPDFLPCIGDLVVLGVDEAVYDLEARVLAAHKGRAYKVQSVSDNRKGRLPHVKAVCS